MPYIAIKAYPKDEKTKQEVVEAINRIFLEKWGCPPEAISIGIEEFSPEEWAREVHDKEVVPNADQLMIFEGKKQF